MIRSASSSASSMSWVTITTVLADFSHEPQEFRLKLGPGVRVQRRERLVEQDELRLIASVRAIATRCRMPCESFAGYDCSKPVSPTSASSLYAYSVAPTLPIRRISRPKVTLRSAVDRGMRRSRAVNPHVGRRGHRRLARGWSARPSLEAQQRAIMSRNVVLPQPLGPTNAVNCPLVIDSDTRSSTCTCTGPRRCGNGDSPRARRSRRTSGRRGITVPLPPSGLADRRSSRVLDRFSAPLRASSPRRSLGHQTRRRGGRRGFGSRRAAVRHVQGRDIAKRQRWA